MNLESKVTTNKQIITQNLSLHVHTASKLENDLSTPASDTHDERQSQAGTRIHADQNGFHSPHRFANFVLIGGF